MDVLLFLAPAFVAGLVLTGIHAYLGLHVVERGVLFVDLALSQIAALGAAIGLLLGFDPHGPSSYGFSLGFCVLGAALFALTRARRLRVPQEAMIGIIYATAAAAAILVMSKTSSETEHLKDMLVGNILLVSWHEIGIDALLYGGIGLFHWIFRKRFLAISLDPEGAYAQGLSLRAWDFLFYVSFGFVVTRSVGLAGVLLVFSYLVVPSVCGMLFARTVGSRLAVAWTIGAVVSALGVGLSYLLELPTGATIVCTFGVTVAVLAVVRGITSPRTTEPERLKGES